MKYTVAPSPVPTPSPIQVTVLPGSPDATPAWLVALAIAAATCMVVAAGVLVYRSTRTRALLTPAYLFYAYFVVFVFIGTAWLFADRGNGSYLHFAGTRDWTALVTVALGSLCFAAGVAMANRGSRFSAIGELQAKHSNGWLDRPPGPTQKFLFWFLALCSLVTCVVLLGLGPVSPLVYLLTHLGQHSLSFDYALDHVRLAFLSPHAGGLPYQATLYQFYGNLLPLLGLLGVGWGVLHGNRRWLVAGVGLLAAALLMAAITLAKNPIENLLVLFFVAFLAFRMRDVRPVHAVVVGAVAMAAFFSEVYVTNTGVNFASVVAAGVRRLFVVQPAVLYSTFEEFPARMGFLHGQGLWRDIVNLRPGPKSTLDYGSWLYTVLVTNQPGFGGVGSAPTAFFGQLYADFGVAGALLGLVAAGYGAQWAYIWYLRSPRTLVSWCVFVGLCASIPRLATSGIVAIVFQYGVMASILFGLYMTSGARLLDRLLRRRDEPAHKSSPGGNGYEPMRYWNELLGESFDLTGVGLVGKSHAFNAWGYRARRNAALSLVGAVSGQSVLDVGSGTGHWVAFWHSLGAGSVTGLDLTPVSVRRLREKFPQDSFVEADVTKRVPADGPFELISAMDVLLHVVDDDGYRHAFRNLRLVARPGSRLLILEPLSTGAPRPMIPGSHSRTRSLAELQSALADSGWRLQSVRPATWLLSNPIEVQPKIAFYALQALWSAISLAARWEPTGQILGAILYPVDRLLCRLPWGPSSKVALAVAV